MKSRFIIIALFLSNLVFGQEMDSLGHEVEHIIRYHSEITVQKNTKVKIVETITVLARQDQIKHGIYREIPLSYFNKGGRIHVGFKLLEVKCDGKKEEYHIENVSNGKIIYIGSEYRRVEQGKHVYQIAYEVDHALSLTENFDELNWNINGNGWRFSIDTTSAIVHLPDGTKIKGHHAYTGYFGAKGNDYLSQELKSGVYFESTNYLYFGENMTVSVAWEKGNLTYPTWFDEFVYFLESYLLWVIGFLGLIFGLLINVFTWIRYGIDPKPGSIIPLFYAPDGFSPAECAFLKNSGRTTDTIFGATLMSLAIKGMVQIETKKTDGDNIYFIRKTENSSTKSKKPLLELEKKFYDWVFNNGKDILIIREGKYNAMVPIVKELATTWIDEKQNGLYYNRNEHLKGRQFIIPLLTLFTGIIGAYFLGGFFGIIIGSIVVQFIVNYIFAKLFEQPTKEGRKKLDEIAGFEMYLKYAETNQIKALNPPTMNFKHFEENLAYAIALDLAGEWTGKFDKRELTEGQEENNLWYGRGVAVGSYSSFCSNLNYAISSASIAPSSGSGFGGGGGGSFGGGFSGGGGGGGGGGGW